MTYIKIFQPFNLDTSQWLLIGVAVFLVGLSRAGIKGISVITVILFTFVFKEKTSTGILVPMLIFGDILAIIYYKRHVKWQIIKKLLPWIVVGVLLAVAIGHYISEVIFKQLLSVIIICSVIMMFYMENRKTIKIPQHKVISISTGILVGFTTMIGNASGPLSNIYFLTMRFTKNEFIGTAAWLFFLVNLIKLPFHCLIWKTITIESLAFNSILLPVIGVGFFVGVYLVKRISNVNYRRFVLFVTAIGGLIMLFK